MAEAPWTPHPSDVAEKAQALRADDVVVQVQRVLSELPASQYESAVRRILASVNRIEADHHAGAAADVLADVPLYQDRSERREIAAAFFERHYRPLVDRSLIFADDLRRHDPRLYGALSAYLAARQRRLSDIVPVRPITIRRRKV